MPNLIAGRPIVPEFFQEAFTPEAVAKEIARLLEFPEARRAMQRDLAEVREKLRGPGGNPIERAAEILAGLL
jgi:lipid-A-disaccharide synthase